MARFGLLVHLLVTLYLALGGGEASALSPASVKPLPLLKTAVKSCQGSLKDPAAILKSLNLLRYLQTFTPIELDWASKTGNTTQNTPGLVKRAGCNVEDLDGLEKAFGMAPGSSCRFGMTCKYSANRWPSWMYQAVKTEPSSCPGSAQCKGELIKVTVLRKILRNGCPVWVRRLELVRVRYRCMAAPVV